MSPVILIIPLAIALILTILSVIFISPRSRQPQLRGFFLWLHRLFNCDALLIDKLLKFFYILLSFAAILIGLTFVFVGIAEGEGVISLAGLGAMLLGPFVIRLLYEMMMLVVILVRNVMEINAKLGGKTVAPAPAPAPAPRREPVRPTVKLCPRCGSKLSPSARFCGVCGQSLAPAPAKTEPTSKNDLIPTDDDL